MSQLLTLIWLKWRLLRNSLRSSKAVVNKAASLLGMLLALIFSFALALILGLVAYFVSQPEQMREILSRSTTREFRLPPRLSSFSFRSSGSCT